MKWETQIGFKKIDDSGRRNFFSQIFGKFLQRHIKSKNDSLSIILPANLKNLKSTMIWPQILLSILKFVMGKGELQPVQKLLISTFCQNKLNPVGLVDEKHTLMNRLLNGNTLEQVALPDCHCVMAQKLSGTLFQQGQSTLSKIRLSRGLRFGVLYWCLNCNSKCGKLSHDCWLNNTEITSKLYYV